MNEEFPSHTCVAMKAARASHTFHSDAGRSFVTAIQITDATHILVVENIQSSPPRRMPLKEYDRPFHSWVISTIGMIAAAAALTSGDVVILLSTPFWLFTVAIPSKPLISIPACSALVMMCAVAAFLRTVSNGTSLAIKAWAAILTDSPDDLAAATVSRQN